MNIKHIVVSLICVVIFIAMEVSAKSMATYQGGTLHTTPNGIYQMVVVHGDWQEMGGQYGYLLKGLLAEFHDLITSDLKKRGLDQNHQEKFALEVFAAYGPELKALLTGVAQGSGLGMDKTLVLNAGMMLLSGAVLQDEVSSACSGLAVWGKRTRDGSLVFGRNWDIQRDPMKKYMKYLGVAVFHPKNGIPFANIHPLGNLYLESGINQQGIFMELNNGEQSDSNVYKDREDTSSVLIRVLSQANSLNDAVAKLCAVPADISYIIQVADSQTAVSVERATFDYRVRTGVFTDILGAYNSFCPPLPDNWEGKIASQPPITQDPRLKNIQTLLTRPDIQGKIDAGLMRDLMDIHVKDGGAMFEGTVLQIVAVPGTLTLWIRGMGYSNWEKIDLTPLIL